MNITERDIKESVDYRSANSTANLCMVMAIVLGSILTTLLIVHELINFSDSTSIVMVAILGVLLALFEVPLWCLFAKNKKEMQLYAKKLSKYVLCRACISKSNPPLSREKRLWL